jgi:hypothetical protein
MQSDGVARASCVNIESSKSLEHIDLSTPGRLHAKTLPSTPNRIIFRHYSNVGQKKSPEIPRRSIKKALKPEDFVREQSKPWIGDVEFIKPSMNSGKKIVKLQKAPTLNGKMKSSENDLPNVETFIKEYELMNQRRMQALFADRQKKESSSTTTTTTKTSKTAIHKKPMKDILFGGVLSKLTRIFKFFSD